MNQAVVNGKHLSRKTSIILGFLLFAVPIGFIVGLYMLEVNRASVEKQNFQRTLALEGYRVKKLDYSDFLIFGGFVSQELNESMFLVKAHQLNITDVLSAGDCFIIFETTPYYMQGIGDCSLIVRAYTHTIYRVHFHPFEN